MRSRAGRTIAVVVLSCLVLAAFVVSPALAGDKGQKKGHRKDVTPPPPTPDPDPAPEPEPPAPTGACALNQQDRGSGTIALTFDDGLRGHVVVADALKTRGICATFYVISQNLRQEPWYTDFLSADEVARMSASGHDIASHTVTHPDLTTLSASELASELRESQATLQRIAGKPVRHLSYPFGASDAAVRSATATYYDSGRGYTDDLADVQAASADRYAMLALGVEQATTLEQAKAYVDWARTNDRTLILVFHDVGGSRQYDWPQASFDALVDHVVASTVDVRTVAELGAAGGLPG